MSQRRKDITHNRGTCPNCGRDVAGGVDHETGHLILRRHFVRPGGIWCSNRERVDAGPASPILAAALKAARTGQDHS